MINQLGTDDKTEQPKACAYGFHKWTIWSDEKQVAFTSMQQGKIMLLVQERTCLRCNLKETKTS